MLTNCNIFFEKFTFRTPYKVTIKGRAAHYGSDYEFKLEYTGTEVNQIIGFIPQDVLRLLKEDLNETVGYGPFQEHNKKIARKLEVFNYSLNGEKAFRNKD
ncbi:hypothetical protein [Bacillus atrophaeus]|uniref:hypothetical protein n=1 Tax=Bacillus atrophaeus TaxID=1452 RepID=UPI000D03512E|nr:hypothetical protein [Bacillus atrophaeus]PRR87349.1 hypothetical protein C6W23_18535 [Bacillus atrophaeus]